ncbi:MAG: flagellar basal body rod protein FlgB [Acetivibrionales bacterium]|jgi:flagellar basal-body rod protein FlgB
MIDKLTGNTTKILEKALDASWLRNETVSQNIANVDTPGYKRKTVTFEEHLAQEISTQLTGRRTDRRHIPIGKKSIEDVPINVTQDNKSLSMRLDGNNVDIENEMASMAKNSIKYNFLIQTISGGFNRIKSAISEGRR